MKLRYTRRQRIVAEIGFSCLMIIIGTILPLVLTSNQTIKNDGAVYALQVLAAVGLGLQLLLYLTKFSKRAMDVYFIVVVLCVPGLIILAV